MSKEYHGINRNKILWGPSINYKKCTSCKTCVEYCKLGVYTTKQEQENYKPVVSYPNKCVVFCTGCENQCPTGAISFPSKQKTRKIIKKLKEKNNY